MSWYGMWSDIKDATENYVSEIGAGKGNGGCKMGREALEVERGRGRKECMYVQTYKVMQHCTKTHNPYQKP